MKLLYCGKCSDIRAFGMSFTPCECGNMQVRWVNPLVGTFEVKAFVKQRARIIGLNNRMLEQAFTTNSSKQLRRHEDWAKAHEQATTAPGYIFDRSKRNCWACIIAPGETSDGGWAPDSIPIYETIERNGFTAYVEEWMDSPNNYQEFRVQVFDSDWKKTNEVYFRDAQVAREWVAITIDDAVAGRK